MKLPPLPKNWREIGDRINTEVNALPTVVERVGDNWKPIGPDGGDCEDYAIGKLRRLHAAGFPIERLRLATCFIGRTGPDKPGEAHVVLAIDAPDDQYVLDNRFPYLLTHQTLVAAGYTRHSIQRVGGSREWVEWRSI